MKYYNSILLTFLLTLAVLLSACSVTEPQEANGVQDPLQEPQIVEEVQEDSQSSFQLYEDARTFALWVGEKAALLEHCSGDFVDSPQGVPSLPYCDEGEVYLDFQMQDGSYVGMDPKTSEYYYFAANSPSGSRANEYTFTPDEKYWIYTDTWSSDQPSYISHNIETGEDQVLFSLLAPASSVSCYGQAFIDILGAKGWNPSKTKLAIVASNEGADSYTTGTKVFVLTLEDGKIVSKNKYNIPVSYTCANGPEYWINWFDDDTLQYFSSEEGEDGYFFRDFYDENGWETEWTRFYDVK